MTLRGQPLGGAPNSTSKDAREYGYKQVSGNQFPCTCKYVYAGINDSYNFESYGNPLVPSVLDPLMADVHGALACELGQPIPNNLPGYVVANDYNLGESIGEHTDADPLFNAVDNPAVILSFNVNRDGMFVVKPKHKGDFATYHCITKT